MTRFLAATVAVTFMAPTVRADISGISFASYADSKQFKVKVTREALEKSPAWKDDAENPPLSARKAIKLANETKESLVKDSEQYVWKLRSVSLEPAGEGRWYWLVNYEAHVRRGGSTGIPPNLRLVVLMDGKVIKPEVKDYRND